MKKITRYQCKADLNLMRKLLGFSKDEVAERLFCSIRSLERIEFENAAPNKDMAIILSDLYKLEFDKQFYIIDKKLEDFIKKILVKSSPPVDYKVNYNKIYYCLYVRKLTHFQDCIFGKGEWIRDYNRNKEVRKLSEINIKTFMDMNTQIPIINESDGWYNWYYVIFR